MFRNLVVLLRYFSFWIIFFFLERAVFVLYNTDKISEEPVSEIMKIFLYGLWMDASMTGYICAMPLLAYVVLWLIPKASIPAKIIKVYSYLLIVLFSIITVINFNIYREWGTKLNFRAFEFAFGSPSEALASTASSPILLTLLVLAALVTLSIFLFRLMVRFDIAKQGNVFLKLVLGLFIMGLNFLAIRGGWQLSPMNESMAYFSQKPILNYAAVNTEWGLVRDMMKAGSTNKNVFAFYSPQEAEAIVKDLYTRPQGENISILQTEKPNIVLIIMESHTGNVVESLGGEKGVSPEMEKLISGGVFFDQVYSSGSRTDKGVVSVLSAFPAQGKRSIMKENSKQVKIPALSSTLADQGYSTSFYYGGESRFFNMKSYLLSHNYQEIIDKNDFESKDLSSKWGAFDGAVYLKMLDQLGQKPSPFFSTFLTLTNHEPFDLPGKPHFRGDDVQNKFRSTAFYADSCLGAFIREAKTKSWYKNTLFVMVADHGHYLPHENLEISDPKRYRVPLIFFGEVIKPEFRGTRIDKVGNQTDIVSTLLSQLNIDANAYPWSRDLLHPQTRDFSFFNWDYGIGVINKTQALSYETVGKNVIYRGNQSNSPQEDEELLKSGKASMQVVYQQLIDF
ncbi:phosphoglycerol transferase MdoB-like AlkP superfamily enzyme [Arcticibacter pallidicorallinus]|uniref:Phosphoglycerol transferase MdoB-like AlkP superfamily enzyme n=1 Tax=Arcticibacter pallidicorallinus TaxID=1259464 RepID=A0A2T0U0N9_9SPHI|nr:alkaline phosphatase family protein [Arcticibacter pallidicorallinus]PRY51463.1 phosphoglycerol transferase MdoB-like AlkP superfamily enzyme [Arcticibacter pallidicorallinus]